MNLEIDCEHSRRTNEVPAHDLNILEMLTVLSQRRKLILLFTLSVAVLSTIVVLIIPSWYTAVTVVMPPAQNSSASALLSQIGGSGALASAAGASLGIKNPNELYVSLFRSRTVEDAMIDRFGLMDRYKKKYKADTRKLFEKRSVVALGAKDGLITIAVSDKDPEMAAKMANGYVEEYRKVSARLAIGEASQRRKFFEDQLRDSKEKLAAAEEAMKVMEQTSGALQIDSQTRALIQSGAELRAQIAAKQVQIQGMRIYATNDNPEMLAVQQQLAALQSELRELTGSDEDSNSGLIVPKGKIPEVSMEYLRRLRDVKYDDTVSELLARQYELARVDEARQGATAQVIDEAKTPEKRSFPLRGISVSVATALAFLAACVWCFVGKAIERLKAAPEYRALRAAFHA